MSLQQGRVGVRSIVMSAFLQEFVRYPGSFWGTSSGQIPRPFHGGRAPRGRNDAASLRNVSAVRAMSGLGCAALPIS